MAGSTRLTAGLARALAAALLVSLAVACDGTPHPATATHSVSAAEAKRIAATTAAFNAIEAKIAARKSLRQPFPDSTAALDIIDYGVNGLWREGIDGAGVTVAYLVTNPDPDLKAAMAAYDKAMDLPPADITEMALPAAADPAAPCQVECNPVEDQLDAEAIHSMAPDAKLLFVHPPVPETDGMQGWPQLAQAIEMIADRHLADVISVSMGDSEADFAGDPTNPAATQQAAIHGLDPALLDAAAQGIPVTFAAGDCGPTGAPVIGSTGQCTPPSGITAEHPADSPWVTAVGGTIPNPGLATKSGRTAPDGLWTSPKPKLALDAAGAGVSTVYPKPSWQQGIPALKHVTGRASPDISMDATDGTSQAAPTFAGVLALATQLNHADLGPVNPALAALGPRGTAAGIIDVPAGYANSAYGITGYATTAGYDIASGWGTIYAPAFVPALVKQVDGRHGAAQPSQQARLELDQLRSDVRVSANSVASGAAVTVTGTGFIPGRTPNGTTIRDGYGVFPPLRGQFGAVHGPYANPASTVPGQTWDTVTATVAGPTARSPARPLTVTGPNGNGTVTATIDTTGMSPGTYTVTITGLLLTQTITFQVNG